MIGLIAHSQKEEAHAAVCGMIEELTKKGIEFELETETAVLAGVQSSLDEVSLARKADLLVVMGGDGTILRVVHRLGANIRPILGVNIGSLGFLTCAGLSEIPRAVESIVNRDFILCDRNLLIAEITASTGERERFHGLNDVVISRGERSQLVRIQVRIDGAELTHYNADGLIRTIMSAALGSNANTAGKINVNEIKLTSATQISTVSPIFAALKYRAFTPSRTMTRGSFLNFQSICPRPTSMA